MEKSCRESELATESGFRNLIASSKNLGSLSELSFRSLGGYFDSVQVSFSDEDQNPVDWHFGSIEIDLAASQSEKVGVAFRIVDDLEFWAKPYSIADKLPLQLRASLKKADCPFPTGQEDENTCIEGFGVSIQMSSAESLAMLLTPAETPAASPSCARGTWGRTSSSQHGI